VLQYKIFLHKCPQPAGARVLAAADRHVCLWLWRLLGAVGVDMAIDLKRKATATHAVAKQQQ